MEDKALPALPRGGSGESGRRQPIEGQWECCLAQASLGVRTALEEAERSGGGQKTGPSLGYRIASVEFGYTQFLGPTATGWASCV